MDIEQLKYQQKLDDLQNCKKNQTSNEPYIQEQNFFSENHKIFDYNEMNKIVANLGRNTVFTLSNGNRVQVVKGNKTILITYGRQGGSKFTASWTTLNDYEEFGEVLQELNSMIGE